MKPFNLEEAKAGKPVCTKDGRPARIICFDRKSNEGYPIVALITNSNNNEDISTYNTAGKFYHAGPSDLDLFMVSKKHEGWTNLYKDRDNPSKIFSGYYIYNSEQAAKEASNASQYIATVKIEWEE